MAEYIYTAAIEWTGNKGEGTSDYRAYDRTWSVITDGKDPIACSNDPILGGDPSKHNPEDLLLASLSSCHMLWYLHLASNAGITVMSYRDNPEAVGENLKSGAGRFLSATLKPEITLKAGDNQEIADAIHKKIHSVCFIARSVNFPVDYAPTYRFKA